MSLIETWPDPETLTKMALNSPEYMHRSSVPIAVVARGLFSPSDCESIVRAAYDIIPHHMPDCDAMFTQDIGHIPELENLRVIAESLNRIYFNYKIDELPHSWMQTYGPKHFYQKHMDASPGTSRKFTAVLMLSDPNEYSGGELTLEYHPASYTVSSEQGALAVFPSWVLHSVSPVVSGMRQTINMGFFGPPFV